VFEEADAMEACIVVSTPAYGSSAAPRTMAAFIAGSMQSLHITNAYFVPTPAFIKNLCDASQRGVDVKVIVPARTTTCHRCGTRAGMCGRSGSAI